MQIGTTIPPFAMLEPASSTGGVTPEASPSYFATYVQPTLAHGLRIWWALYWRTSLVAIGLVYLGFAWIGILMRNDVLTPGAARILATAIPYLFSFLVALFVMHFVVRKRYRAFRIRLTPVASAGLGQELPPTHARTARIWWSYTWRSIIYVVIASFIAYIPMSFVLLAAAAVSPSFARLVGLLVGLVLNGAVGLFVIYSAILDEDVAGVHVALVPAETPRS